MWWTPGVIRSYPLVTFIEWYMNKLAHIYIYYLSEVNRMHSLCYVPTNTLYILHADASVCAS